MTSGEFRTQNYALLARSAVTRRGYRSRPEHTALLAKAAPPFRTKPRPRPQHLVTTRTYGIIMARKAVAYRVANLTQHLTLRLDCAPRHKSYERSIFPRPPFVAIVQLIRLVCVFCPRHNCGPHEASFP